MDEETINKQRTYWQDKSVIQLQDIMLASLEQDNERHKSLLEDLGTSLLCLWKFDKKLVDLRKKQDREELNE